MLIKIVPVVAPALIVIVPLSRLKSVPDPVAVPVTTKSTTISVSDAKGISISIDIEEADSKSEEVVEENPIVGVPSLSLMV